jgi:NAD(P)-dependent dehydrogenase (short-subunit alcohol dehydrogenase family)
MTDFSRRRILTVGSAVAATIGTTQIAQAQTQKPTTSTSQGASNGQFAEKVVLITGATSGIGMVTAKAFAREGAKVFFCGRRENLGAKVQAEIRKAGGDATYMRADVRQEKDVQAFVNGCVAKYGRLDIAFNNAGVDFPPNPIADTPTDEFDDLMNTNARGVFLGMKYEIPQLLKTGGEAIVNMASIGGHRAFPNIVGYGASKAAVIHMSTIAAQEYTGKNIRVNAIAPGLIDTAMVDRVERDWKMSKEQLAATYPIKRIGKPEEVAMAVLWLASDRAAYVSGTLLDIDGGGLG